ncbi:hypothetical protein GQ53DRAFT_822803 [Thozetella sp. PMI_491]|nr:hypothetical protein GQ53DRAFT_822803 [Thozetella sp. PMI_491]
MLAAGLLLLLDFALALPSGDPVARIITITDHITQTDHVTTTDTICALETPPVAKFEIDIILDSPRSDRTVTIDVELPGAGQPIVSVRPLMSTGIPASAKPDGVGVLPPESRTTQAGQSQSLDSPYPDGHPGSSGQPGVDGEPNSSTGLQNGVAPSGTPEPRPIATMQPVIHWDHDMKDLGNLKPCDWHSVYYTESGTAKANEPHSFAITESNLTYPGVILEHSSYVQSVQCLPGGSIAITFSSPEAVSICQSSWTAPMLLISHTSGCGNTIDSATQAYFMVNSITFDNLTVVVVVTEVDIISAVTDIDVYWGHYYPDLPPGQAKTSTRPPQPSQSDIGNLPSPPWSLSGTVPPGQATTVGPSLGGTGTVWISSSQALLNSSSSIQRGTSRTSDTKDDYTISSTTSDTAKPTGTNGPSAKTCGKPPSATIYGFPTAPCGPDFDNALDTAIGFVSFNESSLADTLRLIAPGLSEADVRGIVSSLANIPPNRRSVMRRLVKRSSFSPRIVVQVASSATQELIGAILKQLDKAAELFLSVAKAPGRGAPGDNSGPTVSPDTQFAVHLQPSGIQYVDKLKTYAYPLYKTAAKARGKGKKASIYCIDCSADATLRLSGKLSVSLSNSALKEGYISVAGSFAAGLSIGILSDGAWSDDFNTELASLAVGGFEVPNVVKIDPIASMSANLAVAVSSGGYVKFGTNVTIPNFFANLDLVSQSANGFGFTPTYLSEFEAAGKIAAKAEISLPVTMDIGVEISSLSFKNNVSLTNAPGSQVDAKYEDNARMETKCLGSSHNNFHIFNGNLCNAIYVNIYHSFHNSFGNLFYYGFHINIYSGFRDGFYVDISNKFLDNFYSNT